MTQEEFNRLDEQEKKVLIFEARKVSERTDGILKYELFLIDNFFVETKTSLLQFFRRTMTTYSLKDLPLVYASSAHVLWS